MAYFRQGKGAKSQRRRFKIGGFSAVEMSFGIAVGRRLKAVTGPNHDRILSLLLAQPGIDDNAKDVNNETALHFAGQPQQATGRE